jgi:hypothetical protein
MIEGNEKIKIWNIQRSKEKKLERWTQRIEDGGWKTGGKERIEGRHFGKWKKRNKDILVRWKETMK